MERAIRTAINGIDTIPEFWQIGKHIRFKGYNVFFKFNEERIFALNQSSKWKDRRIVYHPKKVNHPYTMYELTETSHCWTTSTTFFFSAIMHKIAMFYVLASFAMQSWQCYPIRLARRSSKSRRRSIRNPLLLTSVNSEGSHLLRQLAVQHLYTSLMGSGVWSKICP